MGKKDTVARKAIKYTLTTLLPILLTATLACYGTYLATDKYNESRDSRSYGEVLEKTKVYLGWEDSHCNKLQEALLDEEISIIINPLLGSGMLEDLLRSELYLSQVTNLGCEAIYAEYCLLLRVQYALSSPDNLDDLKVVVDVYQGVIEDMIKLLKNEIKYKNGEIDEANFRGVIDSCTNLSIEDITGAILLNDMFFYTVE